MSQKLIYVSNKDSEKEKVTGIHYMPFDENHGLPEDLINANILVDEVAKAEHQEGKVATHYINPKTKEQWFEYEDAPATEEDKFAQLEQQVRDQQDALIELATMIAEVTK